MSGTGCVTPPTLTPPTLVTPTNPYTPDPTAVPATALSKKVKESSEVIQAVCAGAFATAWAEYLADERVAPRPYETAAITAFSWPVGANTLCVIAGEIPTYEIDFTGLISPGNTWAIDYLEVFLDWDNAHDNSPWQMFIKVGTQYTAIESGIASVEIPAPLSTSSPLQFEIVQNTLQPPVPCPAPVESYDIIHEVWKVEANWAQIPPPTLSLNAAPPAAPFSLSLSGIPGGTPLVAPPVTVSAGP